MKGWAASVDRVLQMRRVYKLEQEKQQLIEILQQVEERTHVVVNRERFPVLKDVPRPGGPSKRKMARVGGLRTFAESKRRVEKTLRVESERMQRRTREFEQVMKGDLDKLGDQAAAAAEEKHDGESTAV